MTPVWAPQPSGADLSVSQNEWIAVLASVEKGMDEATLCAHVPSGVDVTRYAEQGSPGVPTDPDPDRKTIAVVAHSTSWSGSIGWSKSILWKQIYTLRSAWKAPPVASAPSPDPLQSLSAPLAPARKPGPSAWSWPWVIGVSAAAGLAYGLHRGWKAWQGRRR